MKRSGYRESSFITEWLLLAAALLMLAVTAAYFHWDEYHEVAEQAAQRLGTQAKVVHDSVSRQIEATDHVLTHMLRELPAWQREEDGMAQANRRLAAFVDAMTGVRTLLVLDAEGRVLAGNHPQVIGLNFRERDYFQAPLNQPDPDQLYVSPPFRTVLGAWGMNVGRMIPGPQGEFNGVVSATLDPQEFRQILASGLYADDMWAAVAHGDGTLFLIMPDHPEVIGSNLMQPSSLFYRHLQSRQMMAVQVGKAYTTSERRMLAHHTVQPPKLNMDRPLVVAVSHDMKTLYAGWWRELWIFSGLLAVFSLLSIGGLHLTQHSRRRARREADQAHRELIENRRFLTDLIENSGTLIYVKDNVGTYQLVNRRWEAATGLPRAQVLGKSDHDIFPEPTAQQFRRHDLEAMQGGEVIEREEWLQQGEQRRYFLSIKFPQRNAAGDVVGICGMTTEITELKQTELALRDALLLAERFQAALDHVGAFIYMKDLEHRYVYANRPTLELFGVSAEELNGSPDTRFFPTAAVERLRELDDRVFSGQETTEEIDVEDAAGNRRVYWEVKAPIYAEDERGQHVIWGLCGISTDITARKLAEDELHRVQAAQNELLRSLAFIDGLTGVANRRRFDEALQTEWRRCRRSGSSLALLMIDIDHFKLYNDHYGHQGGDVCLQAIAATLKAAFGRAQDLVARYGGEEFVCLMPESTLEAAMGKGEELCMAVERLAIVHATSPTATMVTISIGAAATIPDAEEGALHLLQRADEALYSAKLAGRNRVNAAPDAI